MNKTLQQIRSCLVENDQTQILELAKQNKRMLSYLGALTYDPEQLIAWRAITALGVTAGWYAKQDLEFVRIHLRRWMWLLNDESGGIGWRAPEAMGEIIRSHPYHLSEFIPILISTLDLEPEDAPPFRAGTLWALGRLAQVVPDRLCPGLPAITACLFDPAPQTRGMAVWCLSQMNAADAIENWQPLLEDKKTVQIYQDGQITEHIIAELAAQALHKLS
jgi:hypothetical protein